MSNILKQLTRRSVLLLAVVLLALPLLLACNPHNPPTGTVLSGDALAKQYQAADAALAQVKSFVEAQDWTHAREANTQLGQTLAALGPAVYAVEKSTWFSISDAKFDLDGEIVKPKPAKAYVAEKVNEVTSALRTGGVHLGLVK